MSDSYTQDLIAYDKLLERIANLEEKLTVAREAFREIEDLQPINERARRTIAREALNKLGEP